MLQNIKKIILNCSLFALMFFSSFGLDIYVDQIQNLFINNVVEGLYQLNNNNSARIVLGVVGVFDGGLVSNCEAASGGLIPCGRTADDSNTKKVNEANPCTACHFIYMIQVIIEFCLKFSVILATFIIVCAGLLYVVAAGKSNLVELAKSMITGSLVGFVIIFISWAVVGSILTTFGYINPSGGEWHVICDSSSTTTTP